MEERRLPASDLIGTQQIAERLGLWHRESVHASVRMSILVGESHRVV